MSEMSGKYKQIIKDPIKGNKIKEISILNIFN